MPTNCRRFCVHVDVRSGLFVPCSNCVFVVLAIFALPLCTLFFFNDTATTEIYTLSLHDALPIFSVRRLRRERQTIEGQLKSVRGDVGVRFQSISNGTLRELRQPLAEIVVHVQHCDFRDRKSTRLNSSHT